MIKQLLVFTTLFVLGACAILPGAKSADPGILQGTVTVGPLQPVEQVGVPTPTVPPEVYTSRNQYLSPGREDIGQSPAFQSGWDLPRGASAGTVCGQAFVIWHRARQGIASRYHDQKWGNDET